MTHTSRKSNGQRKCTSVDEVHAKSRTLGCWLTQSYQLNAILLTLQDVDLNTDKKN